MHLHILEWSIVYCWRYKQMHLHILEWSIVYCWRYKQMHLHILEEWSIVYCWRYKQMHLHILEWSIVYCWRYKQKCTCISWNEVLFIVEDINKCTCISCLFRELNAIHFHRHQKKISMAIEIKQFRFSDIECDIECHKPSVTPQYYTCLIPPS